MGVFVPTSNGELTMLRYRRDVPARQEMIDPTIEHVRDHLAAIANSDDDPRVRRDEVRISVGPHVDGDPDLVTILGELDAEPDAPYLRDGWTPEQDIADNPLSVPSMEVKA